MQINSHSFYFRFVSVSDAECRRQFKIIFLYFHSIDIKYIGSESEG